MINLVSKNSIRFILLVLLQVLILNHINLSGYINPFLYVLFILLLPLTTPPWLVLVLSMAAGLTIDVFSDTGGLHAAASVFLAFCRPYVLKFLSPREGYEYIIEPSPVPLGWSWFFVYTSVLVLAHHFLLFFLEVFRFSEFFFAVGKALLSAVVTIALVMLTAFLFYKKK